MGRLVEGWRPVRGLLAALLCMACVVGCAAMSKQRLDVRKHLRRFNKPAVKSIKVGFYSLFFVEQKKS